MAACLFDRQDCEIRGSQLQYQPEYDVYCTQNYRNGKSDEGCNNAACGWDGRDCDLPASVKKPVDGSLFFVLNITLERCHDQCKSPFEQFLSLKLGTNMKVKHDKNGHAMGYPFDPQDMFNHTVYLFTTNCSFIGY